MKTRLKIILWTVPLFVTLLAIIYAKVFFTGLLVPWKLVEKPAEKLSEIIGVKFSERKLYVLTASGDVYSIYFDRYFYGYGLIPSPLPWMKEQDRNILTDTVKNYGGEKFTPPPPPFKPVQILEFGIPATESISDIRFALSEDGNLWYWSFGTGGMYGVVYVFILAIGILIYLLALFINFVIVIARRMSRRSEVKPQ